MGGVTIKEYGYGFVWQCLKTYLGDSWPILAIFLAGVAVHIVLLIRAGKKNTEADLFRLNHAEDPFTKGEYTRQSVRDHDAVSDIRSTGRNRTVWLFVTILAVCMLTVCNPILVKKLIPKLGMTTVYYRFFWILPITFGAAYYLTCAIADIRKRLPQALAFLGILAGLALVVPINPGLLNLRMPTNIYKVDGAIPPLCEAIHRDFEKTQRYQIVTEKAEKVTDRDSKKWLNRQSRINPRCIFPYQLEFAVRQYDPTINLTFNRNLRLYYEGNTSTGISYGEEALRYQRRALILDVLYGRRADVTPEEFAAAMKKTKTDYLICEEHLVNGGFLSQAGLKQVGIVAGYTIFRYGD